MATYKFRIQGWAQGANDSIAAVGSFVDTSGGGSFLTPVFTTSFYATSADATAIATINKVRADIVTEAGNRAYTGFTTNDIEDLATANSLPLAPQAAVSDCPADAVTNYNVITTLLGSLTGAVNTTNTKQNQIATQFNSLLAELRTLKIISP